MKHNSTMVWSATPTPFLADGSLDKMAIHNLVERHVSLGIGGLFACGTSGEGLHMPDMQRDELVTMLKLAAGERLHLSAQVSDTSAIRVRDNMRRMTDAGADSLMLGAPVMPRFCTKPFLRRYFMEALDCAPLPVGIYVTKCMPGVDLSLELWQELAMHPQVHYLKDSSACEETAKAMMTVKRQRPDLCLLTGCEFNVLATAKLGYDGGLVGTGILNGRMIRRALEAVHRGDAEAAAAWQKRANDFMFDIFRRDLSAWLGGLKYALVRLGIFSNEFMHLCFPLTDADRRRIDAALEREQEWITP